MLSCWRGSFQSHMNYKGWNAVPLCVLWIILGDCNMWTFDGLEQPIHMIKSSLLRCLYGWMVVLRNIPSCSALDFVDILNLKL
jgi:hypothetical protein